MFLKGGLLGAAMDLLGRFLAGSGKSCSWRPGGFFWTIGV